MILHEISVKENGTACRLSGIVEKTNGKTIEVFFEYPIAYKDFLNVSADPFFPVLLIPAMEKGEKLEIVPDISKNLLDHSGYVQEIFTNWYPDVFREVEIVHHNLHERKKVINNAAQFFSLGVDSFYTLIKNREKNLKYLIYMQGLELPLTRYKYKQEEGVLAGISEVEKHYNVQLIHGKTNLRDHFKLDWPKYYHGPGLAGTALSLSCGFDTIFIPSSHSYGAHIPVGSSFMIDHYWSTEQLNVVHDGAEKGRSFKLSDLVAKDNFALDQLRVCTENDGGDYNCCRCRKCISTMLSLEIIGKLQESKAFPEKNTKGRYHCLAPKSLSSYALTKDIHNIAIKYKRYDIAKKVEKELNFARHDLLGRKELSMSLAKYTQGFVSYLLHKIIRGQ